MSTYFTCLANQKPSDGFFQLGSDQNFILGGAAGPDPQIPNLGLEDFTPAVPSEWWTASRTQYRTHAWTDQQLHPALTSSYSIWYPSGEPVSDYAATPNAYTLGTSFVPNVAGSITALKFLKPAGDTTTSRNLILWSASGAVLATVATSAEPIGIRQWLGAALSTPYVITPGTTYFVTYDVPSTGTYCYIGGPVSSAQITCLEADWYAVGAGIFPTNPSDGHSSFADIVLTTSTTEVSNAVPRSQFWESAPRAPAATGFESNWIPRSFPTSAFPDEWWKPSKQAYRAQVWDNQPLVSPAPATAPTSDWWLPSRAPNRAQTWDAPPTTPAFVPTQPFLSPFWAATPRSWPVPWFAPYWREPNTGYAPPVAQPMFFVDGFSLPTAITTVATPPVVVTSSTRPGFFVDGFSLPSQAASPSTSTSVRQPWWETNPRTATVPLFWDSPPPPSAQPQFISADWGYRSCSSYSTLSWDISFVPLGVATPAVRQEWWTGSRTAYRDQAWDSLTLRNFGTTVPTSLPPEQWWSQPKSANRALTWDNQPLPPFGAVSAPGEWWTRSNLAYRVQLWHDMPLKAQGTPTPASLLPEYWWQAQRPAGQQAAWNPDILPPPTAAVSVPSEWWTISRANRAQVWDSSIPQPFGTKVPITDGLAPWYDPPQRWNAPPGFEPQPWRNLGTTVPTTLPPLAWFDPPQRWKAGPGFEPHPLKTIIPGTPTPSSALPTPWFDPPKRWVAPPGFEPTQAQPFGTQVPKSAPPQEWWAPLRRAPPVSTWTPDVFKQPVAAVLQPSFVSAEWFAQARRQATASVWDSSAPPLPSAIPPLAGSEWWGAAGSRGKSRAEWWEVLRPIAPAVQPYMDQAWWWLTNRVNPAQFTASAGDWRLYPSISPAIGGSGSWQVAFFDPKELTGRGAQDWALGPFYAYTGVATFIQPLEIVAAPMQIMTVSVQGEIQIVSAGSAPQQRSTSILDEFSDPIRDETGETINEP